MKKEYKEQSFDDLVNAEKQRILLGLIDQGGKGLHSAVWQSLNMAIMWAEQQREKIEEEKKEVRKILGNKLKK